MESGGEKLDILPLPWSPGTCPGCLGFFNWAFTWDEADLQGWENKEEERGL